MILNTKQCFVGCIEFNTTFTDKVISWRSVTHMIVFPVSLTPVLTHISFQSHRLLFSHASAEVRGENTPERNFPSTGSQTHILQCHESDTPTTEPPGRGKLANNTLTKAEKSPLDRIYYNISHLCM